MTTADLAWLRCKVLQPNGIYYVRVPLTLLKEPGESMAEARVPDWHVAVGRTVRPEEVYGVFRALLDDLPMSRTELARRLRITQPAVSRWASGVTRPGIAEMRATLDAVAARTAEIQGTARRAESIVSLVEEAVRMHAASGAAKEPRQEDERREITERLAKLLEEN